MLKTKPMEQSKTIPRIKQKHALVRTLRQTAQWRHKFCSQTKKIRWDVPSRRRAAHAHDAVLCGVMCPLSLSLCCVVWCVLSLSLCAVWCDVSSLCLSVLCGVMCPLSLSVCAVWCDVSTLSLSVLCGVMCPLSLSLCAVWCDVSTLFLCCMIWSFFFSFSINKNDMDEWFVNEIKISDKLERERRKIII